MFNKIKRIITLIILILLAFGFFNMLESEFFYITEININKTNEIVEKDILKNLEDFKNKPLSYVNTGLLKEDLLKDIRIKSVNIKKQYPNKLNVNIELRKGIALVNINGKYYVVDKDLNVFGKLFEIDYGILPIIYYDEKNKDDLINILDKVYESKLYNLTSEILKTDNYYTIILDSGVRVYANKDVSLKKLNQGFIVYNKELELQNKLEYIDLRFENINVK